MTDMVISDGAVKALRDSPAYRREQDHDDTVINAIALLTYYAANPAELPQEVRDAITVYNCAAVGSGVAVLRQKTVREEDK